MLVISRKPSETILIGNDIEIIISEISGDKVKIAIQAPKEISILRGELVETAKQNAQANTRDIKKAVDALKGMLKHD